MTGLALVTMGMGVMVLALIGFTWFGVRRIEKRHPAIGEFLELQIEHGGDRHRIKIHYTLQGQRDSAAPTLVLLHGASSSLYDFHSSIVPLLVNDYRVVTIDRPGLGYSCRAPGRWMSPLDQAVVIDLVLGQLGIRRPILVGHSWSAALVMAYLLAYPGAARAAVLIAPATHSWYTPAALYNRISRAPMIGWLFRWTLVYPLGSIALGSGIKTVFYQGQMPSEYRRRAAIDLVLRPASWKSNADDLCLLNDFLVTQEGRYPEVSQPVLAIIGDSDKVVWNEIHAGTLSRQLDNFTLMEMAKTGHAPHQSHPHRTVEEITRWVAQTAGQPSWPPKQERMHPRSRQGAAES